MVLQRGLQAWRMALVRGPCKPQKQWAASYVDFLQVRRSVLLNAALDACPLTAVSDVVQERKQTRSFTVPLLGIALPPFAICEA
eukprot:1676751-Rhodomonas_salina.1